MIDVVEILQHWHAGRSKSLVAASVGVDRETVRKYVAPAEAAGLAPGGPSLSRAEWAELVAGWFPELVDAKARSLTWPSIDAHRERIGDMLKTNTVTTVHQRLRDEHGLTASIASFRRYVWLQFPDRAAARAGDGAAPDRCRPARKPRSTTGSWVSWLDPVADRVRRVWAFVMVLACSRHMFVRPVLRLDAWAWVDAHVAAFAFFDGVPARLVPDNLRTGVDRPDLYDPKLNRAYGELGRPLRLSDRPGPGVEAEGQAACRTADAVCPGQLLAGPQLGVGRARCRPPRWCGASRWPGSAATAAWTAPPRTRVFQAVERRAMRALPSHAFELARWSTPKVGVGLPRLGRPARCTRCRGG